ncbi:glycine/D-amino acid oxidase-like deaminating enzyme [Maribacter spongiicola]|uniref:Glycine/D-amino acid oxidase-like deaminating enzyme n=1 Tax=Maribacter spongiicola TaxID=1206753 RepID=A0A4R7K4R3_9FLAO|nr:FAD-dependent oxidoreductase [Maribacter spongiicola]TDT46197.1 glycine/D-amino acid oxidase-like deaminating enzyme [Maribacter spongiicola]
MNLSYWERTSWFSNIEFTIIGSGIVGLNCALELRRKHPKARILILEKGKLPQGASTKNAGFACFGSISEILSDLKTHSEQEVINLVQERYDGIYSLRNLLGDAAIGYEINGGHELFLKKDLELYERCLKELKSVNELLHSVFKADAFKITPDSFNFNGINNNYISQIFEGQIDTGKMMHALVHLAQLKGITILNNTQVEGFQDSGTTVTIKTTKLEFTTKKLLIATNGFAAQLITENVKPARAQVLITKPIKNLHIKGTFHLEEGYYYFRNIDNRVLLGGGRNLDFKTEETTEFGTTALVSNKLKELLKTVILPEQPFEIDYSWSGIMGVGQQKKPIVKQLSENVACGVRLGGMGVAIGSTIGKKLAQLIS